jgi:hypothetical protein
VAAYSFGYVDGKYPERFGNQEIKHDRAISSEA